MEEQNTKEEKPKTSSSKYLLIVGIIVIIIAAFFIFESQSTKTSSPAMTAAPQKTTTSSKPAYKDGTYTAEGTYVTHVGEKRIKVTVTLKNDIITSSDVSNEADDPTSVNFQNSFIGGYKELVIGKNISSVHLTKVARSSLTPAGFNQALKSIEEQAKS